MDRSKQLMADEKSCVGEADDEILLRASNRLAEH
jgi:hypothetical protein